MNETLNIQNGVSPITIDTKVTEGSMRPVTGGGIAEAISTATEPFVVSLTVTAPDYSGTMDKTVGDITEAYYSGKRIIFRLTFPQLGEYELNAFASASSSFAYPYFHVIVINNTVNVLGDVFTRGTDTPDENRFVTYLYTLTPAT